VKAQSPKGLSTKLSLVDFSSWKPSKENVLYTQIVAKCKELQNENKHLEETVNNVKTHSAKLESLYEDSKVKIDTKRVKILSLKDLYENEQKSTCKALSENTRLKKMVSELPKAVNDLKCARLAKKLSEQQKLVKGLNCGLKETQRKLKESRNWKKMVQKKLNNVLREKYLSGKVNDDIQQLLSSYKTSVKYRRKPLSKFGLWIANRMPIETIIAVSGFMGMVVMLVVTNFVALMFSTRNVT